VPKFDPQQPPRSRARSLRRRAQTSHRPVGRLDDAPARLQQTPRPPANNTDCATTRVSSIPVGTTLTGPDHHDALVGAGGQQLGCADAESRSQLVEVATLGVDRPFSMLERNGWDIPARCASSRVDSPLRRRAFRTDASDRRRDRVLRSDEGGVRAVRSVGHRSILAYFSPIRDSHQHSSDDHHGRPYSALPQLTRRAVV